MNISKLLTAVETYSPFLSRRIAIKYLNLASPFNGHLKADLRIWTDKKTVIKVSLHRAVKNHLGGIHAGALFTLGESCAGLLLIKNFSPSEFRLILQSAAVEYSRQARSAVEGISEISSDRLLKIKASIKPKSPFLVPMETVIGDLSGETVCVVKTQWQLKPWDQVKTK